MTTLGKPLGVCKDLTEYTVEIEAPKKFLPLLVQRFTERGYSPEKIKGHKTFFENTIAVRRRLPNESTEKARYVVGNRAHICKMFGLQPIPDF